MRGVLRFHLLGRDLDVDVNAINTTAGNGYAFLREFSFGEFISGSSSTSTFTPASI
jgi:hypothetical protein